MNAFMKASLIRAIRTICQTAIATIGSAVVLSDVDWKFVVSASVLAGIISVLTSIATGLPEAEPAIEATEDDMAGVVVEPYNTENYDDLYIDDNVDEGEDDELEQEK